MSEPALRVVANPEFERLDALKAERRNLREEHGKLIAIKVRLDAAQESERKALAAIGELSAGEVAAMTSWASAGAAGDPPQPDMQSRQALARDLAAAQAAAASARGASADLDRRHSEIGNRLAVIEKELDLASIIALKAQLDAELPELQRLADRVARGLADRAALRMIVAEIGRAKSDGGDLEAGRPYFQLGERMAGEAAIETLPTNGQVLDAIEDHKRKLAQLREGAR